MGRESSTVIQCSETSDKFGLENFQELAFLHNPIGNNLVHKAIADKFPCSFCGAVKGSQISELYAKVRSLGS